MFRPANWSIVVEGEIIPFAFRVASCRPLSASFEAGAGPSS